MTRQPSFSNPPDDEESGRQERESHSHEPPPDPCPGQRFFDFCGGDEELMQTLAARAQLSPVFKFCCGDRQLNGNDPNDAGVIEALLLWEYEAGRAKGKSGTDKLYMLMKQVHRKEDVGAADPFLYKHQSFLEMLKETWEEEKAEFDEATADKDDARHHSNLAKLISIVSAKISKYQSLPPIEKMKFAAECDNEDTGTIAASETPAEAEGPDEAETAAAGGADKFPARELKIRPCDELAYSQFKFAVRQDASLTTERKVYDWLNEHENIDKLPSFPTWSRYVRKARESLGAQKNSRRIDRPTNKSVVPADQIEF